MFKFIFVLFTMQRQIFEFGAVVVAQLAELSLPIPEVRGSILDTGEFLILTYIYCEL